MDGTERAGVLVELRAPARHQPSGALHRLRQRGDRTERERPPPLPTLGSGSGLDPIEQPVEPGLDDGLELRSRKLARDIPARTLPGLRRRDHDAAGIRRRRAAASGSTASAAPGVRVAADRSGAAMRTAGDRRQPHRADGPGWQRRARQPPEPLRCASSAQVGDPGPPLGGPPRRVGDSTPCRFAVIVMPRTGARRRRSR